MSIPFVLASASPARKKLLQTAGIEPIVCQSGFDESQIQKEAAKNLVETLAECKAQAVSSQFHDGIILGCDSVLEVAGNIYGKPDSPEEAIANWQQMSGDIGILYTGHALLDLRMQQKLICCGVTKVYFKAISDRTIRRYVATGEPLKCAGSFALEGKGSFFVEKIDGCHSNVIGLSMPLLHEMLQTLGYDVTDFWN